MYCPLSDSFQCLSTDQQVDGEKGPRHDYTEEGDPHLDPPRSEMTLGEHVVNEKVKEHNHTRLGEERGGVCE